MLRGDEAGINESLLAVEEELGFAGPLSSSTSVEEKADDLIEPDLVGEANRLSGRMCSKL